MGDRKFGARGPATLSSMSTFHHGLGFGGGGRGSRRRGGGASGDDPPPLLDPARERDSRRIARMFKPYRARLASVIGLIVFSSGLSMLSPFLLRDVLDKGIL